MHRILENLNSTIEWYTGIKGMKLKFITEKNEIMYYAYNFTVMQMGVLSAISNQAFIVCEIDKKKVTRNGYLPIVTNIGFVLKENDQELKHQLKEIFYLNPSTETIYTEMQVEGEITRTDLLRIKKSA